MPLALCVLKDMKLLSIDLHLPANITVTANVYTLTGTHLGNETNPDAWFLVCRSDETASDEILYRGRYAYPTHSPQKQR